MSKEAMKLALELIRQSKIQGSAIDRNEMLDDATKALEEALAKQEQGEPVAWQERQAKRMKDGVVIEWTNWYPCRYRTIDEAQAEACDHIPYEWRPLYTTPQPAPKPLMLEKFREMEALLDDSNAPQHKTITDDELKIIMETTMPVIDWKARYGVELNNGERNKWMLEWFIAFARAIEAAHGIKE